MGGAGDIVFFGSDTATDNRHGEAPQNATSSGDAYTVVIQKDEDLEGEGYAIPDHAVLYDVDMDPEDRTAVFDLALSQDSDDGGLLDWDALAGKHRYRCCGCDCSCCACCSCVPPEWWYSYSKRQRSFLWTCLCLGVVAVFVALGIGIMLWAVLSQHSTDNDDAKIRVL